MEIKLVEFDTIVVAYSLEQEERLVRQVQLSRLVSKENVLLRMQNIQMDSLTDVILEESQKIYSLNLELYKDINRLKENQEKQDRLNEVLKYNINRYKKREKYFLGGIGVLLVTSIVLSLK